MTVTAVDPLSTRPTNVPRYGVYMNTSTTLSDYESSVHARRNATLRSAKVARVTSHQKTGAIIVAAVGIWEM